MSAPKAPPPASNPRGAGFESRGARQPLWLGRWQPEKIPDGWVKSWVVGGSEDVYRLGTSALGSQGYVSVDMPFADFTAVTAQDHAWDPVSVVVLSNGSRAMHTFYGRWVLAHDGSLVLGEDPNWSQYEGELTWQVKG